MYIVFSMEYCEISQYHTAKESFISNYCCCTVYVHHSSCRYDDVCPEACANFLKLCTGENRITPSGTPLFYRNCPIHRLVSGGWLQCGDIVDGTGQYSMSAGGEDVFIRDESFAVDFSLPEGGIVGYSSSGPHANGSQFFITFGPCEWMQNSFVGFGRVVVGNSILRLLEREPTSNQKPNKNIIITGCGEEK